MVDDKTVLEKFYDTVEKNGSKTFMTQPVGGGEIKTFSYDDVLAEAKKVAGYIDSLGLPANSQIAICSKNTAWWVMTDLAIWMTGHVSVPVFPTLTAETTKYILEHSEAQLLFIGKLDAHPWAEMKNGVPEGMKTVAMPLSPKDHGADKTWDEITATEPLATPVRRTRDQMSTIIYTSGSTGKPKGVMTSFGAMVDATAGIDKRHNITPNDRYLSYLPIAHGMERWLGEVMPLITGCQLFYAESLSTFAQDLGRARPTLFMSVPRLWTKFQSKVFQKIPEKTCNMLMSIPLINILFKKKLLKTLGLDKARLAGSGSAPIPGELVAWYRKLGLELLEGYGMTENFNYSHLTIKGKSKVGRVGNPYEDVEQRIAADGEIQVKTPGKMMGYFKNEEATKETITEDGYVRTGDKGDVDSSGSLAITGRTKEIFKTSKGKYVAPAPIENLLITNHLLELACVSGRAQPQPHAIVQLAEDPKKKALASADTRAAMTAELEKYVEESVNAKVDGHEHLDFIAIVKEEWLPENGFLTPTQKIKRSTIEGEYEKLVEGWYGEKKKVIWVGEW